VTVPGAGLEYPGLLRPHAMAAEDSLATFRALRLDGKIIVFYPTPGNQSFGNRLMVQDSTESPQIPCSPEDENVFLSPAVELERAGDTVAITALSAMCLSTNLWFDVSGRVEYMSPCLLWFLCTAYLVANGSEKKRFSVLPPSVFIGDRRIFNVPSPRYYAWTCKNMVHNSVYPHCKCKKHGRIGMSDTRVHPDSEFVVGQPVCRTCYNVYFERPPAGWIHKSRLERLFSPDMIRVVISPLLKGSLQHVLMGAVIWRMRSPHNPGASVSKLLRHGREYALSPRHSLSRAAELCPLLLMAVRMTKDPVVWRMYLDAQKAKHPGFTDMTDFKTDPALRSFHEHTGWHVRPPGSRPCRAVHGETTLEDPTVPALFQSIRFSRHDVVCMDTDMHAVLLRLREGDGRTVRLVVCSPDYQPAHCTLDARGIGVPTALPPRTSVAYSECVTWSFLLAVMKKAKHTTLYGCPEKSAGAIGSDPGAPGEPGKPVRGVYAELLMLSRADAGFEALTTAPPGVECTPLSGDKALSEATARFLRSPPTEPWPHARMDGATPSFLFPR